MSAIGKLIYEVDQNLCWDVYVEEARAELHELLETLRWIERETAPEDGRVFEQIHAKAAAAIAKLESPL